MGKQPAVLIIARHGARLDVADKDWQTNAKQPWNTPLSYGGWMQCQGLGARIAVELQNLDAAASSDTSNRDGPTSNPRPRKRRKVTIHSSPYLRCVQTSIAIAAGMRSLQDPPRGRPQPAPFQRSSLSRPPRSADEPPTMSPPTDHHFPPAPRNTDKGLTDLKLDSWLGEWLSADYFDQSQPPPPSEELVRNAKETLKQPSEEIKGAELDSSISEFDEFELASKQKLDEEVKEIKETKDIKAMPIHEKTGLRAMAAKGYAMPRRTRTASLMTGQSSNGSPPASELIGRRPRSTTYSPPVPMYSIAPRDTIPIGFVAHARDACIESDFEWDSEKAPLLWGDGGKYTEEWSAMHRRFRNGLQNILSYYESEQLCEMDLDGEDSDEELVLILVTHQAGCNALIRLVTGAPALHDVGTASLTLAVRRPGLTRQISAQLPRSPTRRRGSLDMGINNDFEMKIIASTEHLRGASNPLGLNSPRLAMSPALASRRMTGADSAEGFSLGDSWGWRSSSQSTITGGMHGRRAGSISTESVNSTGLWSMRDARSSSISSEISIDPRSTPVATPRTSTDIMLEDKAIEENALSSRAHLTQSAITSSPIAIDNQSVWQPPTKPRPPVRSGSTRMPGPGASSTGLWGSPVNNPGGVKEGTPHSRASFGMSDAPPLPAWSPRSSRFSFQASKIDIGSMQEEDES